jgi:ribosomal protein L16/L10AE
MERRALSTLYDAILGLRISPASSTRSNQLIPLSTFRTRPASHVRYFSSTPAMAGNWLEPFIDRTKKMFKGRARCPTGGSTKGTTIAWGDYGLRMKDHHRRISAKQLKLAEDTIKTRLRGQRYRLYKRVNCDVGVYVSGNEVCPGIPLIVPKHRLILSKMRMGKGKGTFDHWATRVAINQIVFELKGALHEQVARDAFRLAGNKLPGMYCDVDELVQPTN